MQMLTLLKMGCEIRFPSGYILRGDPANNYIDTLYEVERIKYPDRLRILDKEGIKQAVQDERDYRKKIREK
jgi:hypothetical protein